MMSMICSLRYLLKTSEVTCEAFLMLASSPSSLGAMRYVSPDMMSTDLTSPFFLPQNSRHESMKAPGNLASWKEKVSN